MDKLFDYNDIFNFINFTYYKLLVPYHNSFKEVLSPLQFYTLCVIKYYKTITMTQLSISMKMPKQNMTKIINKLINVGFIERLNDPKDKRITNITLSEEGNNFLINTAKFNAKKINNSIIDLGEEKAENFYNAINTLNNILSNIKIDALE